MKKGYFITGFVVFLVFMLDSRLLADIEEKYDVNYWDKLCVFKDKKTNKPKPETKNEIYKFLYSLSQKERLKLLMQFSESDECKKMKLKEWYNTPFFILSIMDNFLPKPTPEEINKVQSLPEKKQWEIIKKYESLSKDEFNNGFEKIVNALTDKNNKKYHFFRFAMFVMFRGEYSERLTQEQAKRVTNLALKLYKDKTECEPVRNECLHIVSDDLYGKLEKSIKSIMVSDATAEKAIKKEGLQIVLEKIKKNEFKLNPEAIKKLQPFLTQAKEFCDYLEKEKKNEKISAVYRHTIDCALSQMQLLPLNLLEN